MYSIYRDQVFRQLIANLLIKTCLYICFWYCFRISPIAFFNVPFYAFKKLSSSFIYTRNGDKPFFIFPNIDVNSGIDKIANTDNNGKIILQDDFIINKYVSSSLFISSWMLLRRGNVTRCNIFVIVIAGTLAN